MVAFIDDAMNIHHIDTFVLYASPENVASSEDLPNFFCECIDDSRISCSPILVMMHQVSLCWRSSPHFLLGCGLSGQVSCGLDKPSLDDSLGHFQLRSSSRNVPVS